MLEFGTFWGKTDLEEVGTENSESNFFQGAAERKVGHEKVIQNGR